MLGAVVLLLALVAESMGPAAFWPAVTAGVLAGACRRDRAGGGRRRPAWAMRQDRAAARHAGVLMPGMASDLLSAVELAGPAPPIRARRRCRRRWCSAFQDYVAGSVGAVDARRLVPLRPAARASRRRSRRSRAVIAAGTLSPMMARGLRTLDSPAVAVRGRGDLDGAARRRRPHHLHLSGVHRAGPAHRRGIDGRRRRREGHARAHRDAPAARRPQGAAAARRDGQQGRDRRRRFREARWSPI